MGTNKNIYIQKLYNYRLAILLPSCPEKHQQRSQKLNCENNCNNDIQFSL